MEFTIVVVAFGVRDKETPSREPQPPSRFRATVQGLAIPRVGEFVEIPGTKFVGITFMVNWAESEGHALAAEVHVMVHLTPSGQSDIQYQLLAGSFQRDGWPTPFEVDVASRCQWWDLVASSPLSRE